MLLFNTNNNKTSKYNTRRSQLALNDYSYPDLLTENHKLSSTNTSNTIQITSMSMPSISELTVKFRKYLDVLCLNEESQNKDISSYPSDCIQLLQSMINISITQRLSQIEIDILAQRVEYLHTNSHMNNPILFIHIPKTGGTGFGKWLTSYSSHKTVHVWVPDGVKENVFDSNHFPNRKKRATRRRLPGRRPIRKPIGRYTRNRTAGIRQRPRINNNLRKRGKNTYPDLLYGHLAYGFDSAFLTPDEIKKLGQSPPGIVWKPRVNFTYITVLRNPITRVPSHYYYHKKGLKDENHKWTINRNLYDWIGYFEESQECMVQFISGCHQRAWWSKKYKDIWDPNLDPWPRRFPEQSPDIFKGKRVSFEQYMIARRHLLEMGWVGLTEYMAQSVEQLKIFWHTGRKHGSRKDNVNKRKPKQQDQRTLDKIKEFNKYDIMLWDLGYVLYLQQEIVVKYAFDADIERNVMNSEHGAEPKEFDAQAQMQRLRNRAKKKNCNIKTPPNNSKFFVEFSKC